ncbi:MAG: hypothetical protein WCC36_16630 [Gammaproteobacteria bacterium]
MERPERPVSAGVAAALTWISAALLGGGGVVVGVPGEAHPVPWACVALLWLLTAALVVSAYGMARQRRILERFAGITLTLVVVLLAPTAVGPYLLLNVAALGLVVVGRHAPRHSVRKRFAYRMYLPSGRKAY